MAAKDTEGNYLLADKYRNTDTTNSLASAFNKCMSLAANPPVNTVPLLTRQGPKPGVFFRPSGSAAHLRLITQPNVEQHWQVSFDNHNVSYRDLTMIEAEGLIAEKRASFQSAFGILDWLEDVGDFLEGVADGIVNIVDTIVTTVSNGVQAVFTFIVDGVTLSSRPSILLRPSLLRSKSSSRKYSSGWASSSTGRTSFARMRCSSIPSTNYWVSCKAPPRESKP